MPEIFESTVAALVQSAFGREAGVEGRSLVRDGLRCRVHRLALSRARCDTAILKEIKSSGEPMRGLMDCASLQFAGRAAQEPRLVPRFYGADRSRLLYLIEDIAPAPTFAEVLEGSSREAADDSALAIAESSARLHGAFAEGEEDFDSRRRSLGIVGIPDRAGESVLWTRSVDRFRDWFPAAGCKAEKNVSGDLAAAARVYAEPEDYLAFTSGDPAPSNVLLSGGAAVLIDFEYGGFRNALYDLSAWNVLCPLPQETVVAMKAQWRSVATGPIPGAADEDRFNRHWTAMNVYRTVAMLTWISPDILRENRPWAGEWTCREAVLAALGRAHGACMQAGCFEAAGDALGVLHSRLRRLWPEYENELRPWWPAYD